jgi:peptidoglycan/xylan/chitin deacetylase (PgdA/CDA1 family)
MNESRRLFGGFLLLLILSFTFPRIVYAQPAAATKQEAAEKGGGDGYACRCVAFRLDDVSDTNYPYIEDRLLDVFQNSNTSLTVGIIGNRFGNNQEIVSHLAAMLKVRPQILEVANHGWNHEDFSALSLGQQAALMQKTDEKIYGMLKVSPTVFIAPFNKINNSTFLAAKKNEMNTVSSGPAIDPPASKVSPDSAGMYHLPFSALTAYVDKDGKHWDPVPLATIERNILNGLENHGYAVVEMHPQEFAPQYQDGGSEVIDENHMATIESLIQWLHSAKIDVVTLGSFASASSAVPEFQSSLPLILALAAASAIALYRVSGYRNSKPAGCR